MRDHRRPQLLVTPGEPPQDQSVQEGAEELERLEVPEGEEERADPVGRSVVRLNRAVVAAEEALVTALRRRMEERDGPVGEAGGPSVGTVPPVADPDV